MNEDLTLNQTTGTSTKAVALRYGFITGFVTVIYSLILNITEQNTNTWLGYISFIILIVGIVMAHKHYKSENHGFMTYGQGLGIGSLLSLIVGALSGIFMYIYIKLVDNSFMERMQEQQIVELEKRGMSDEQIEQAIQVSQKMTSPEMMVVWAIVGTLLFGFILSLIISAITKHARPEFE
jgi:amino acid transporter